MALTISDGGGVRAVSDDRTQAAPVEQPTAPVPQCEAPEPTQPPVPSLPEHRLPPGTTLRDATSGTQAQPFDVTMSQLATAVYNTRGGPPEGWTSVTDQQLRDRGIADPQAWRLTHLGFNDCTQKNAQEFRADIYTDGNGNFVLSYRGTAEGGADWDNNFRQGLGFETRDGDKFSVTAANTGVEFARVFGNNGANSDNLAITGHSQGGGLATVGSIASGVPAVTFDASGVHPNTWDRMGIDPQRARDIAEGGQIRAYSLADDALTKAQDSWVTGLVAPDALGTQIVVEPAAADEHAMFTNHGPIEGFTPEQSEAINTGVELARNPLTGVPIGAGGGFLVGSLFGGPLGGTGGLILGPLLTTGAGDIAYSAISHSPNALTAGMIENQPWQPGYENPSSLGRDLQNLLPDTLKDDYTRNTHDFVSDIGEVASTDFANGDYVRGGFRIAGDFAEGFFNSAGDTLDAGIDGLGGLANTLIDGTGQLANRGIDAFGNLAQTGFNVTGDLADAGIDLVGDGVQALGDGGAQVLRHLGDTVGLPGVGNLAGTLVEDGSRLVNQGIDRFGDGVEAAADGLGVAANATIDFVGDGVELVTDGLGDAANATIDVLGDGVALVSDGFGTAVEATADAAGTLAQGVTDGAQAVGDFLNPFN